MQRSALLEFAGLQRATLQQQLLQPGEPNLVVAEFAIVGERLARGTAAIDVPETGRAHGKRERQNARFPGSMKQFILGLWVHGPIPVLAAEIGVRAVAHDETPAAGAPGSSGRPVPIMESRVTRLPSSRSPRCSDPAGRCGSTR